MANKLEDISTPEWETVDEAIRSRLTEVTTWLKEHASEGSFGGPGEMGNVERGYWHYGYLSALQDMRAVILRRKSRAN